MPGTIPVLELKQDGDVESVRIKCAGAKAVLKDLQTYLKKKTAIALLTTYPYGAKRISIFGFVKGKESELTQHQLPPPCDATEIYGNVLLIAHSSKTTWDVSAEPFTPADYEAFYEKACSGELEEIDADDEDAEEEAAEEDIAEEEEEEAVADEDALDDEAPVDEIIEEEEAPRVRVSRKVVKIDPQQLQFQFKSSLLVQAAVDAAVVEATKQRKHIVDTVKAFVGSVCDENQILQLEMGIYNAALSEATRRLVPLTWEHENFRWIYTMIAKRTVSNFDPASYVKNESLMERWQDGEFTLDALGHWPSYDLKPAHWTGLKDQQFRREKRILEGNLAMATDRFRCSQCKKKMCSYYELQTRSADEPMTIFISCLNCGKNWKQ